MRVSLLHRDDSYEPSRRGSSGMEGHGGVWIPFWNVERWRKHCAIMHSVFDQDTTLSKKYSSGISLRGMMSQAKGPTAWSDECGDKAQVART